MKIINVLIGVLCLLQMACDKGSRDAVEEVPENKLIKLLDQSNYSSKCMDTKAHIQSSVLDQKDTYFRFNFVRYAFYPESVEYFVELTVYEDPNCLQKDHALSKQVGFNEKIFTVLGDSYEAYDEKDVEFSVTKLTYAYESDNSVVKIEKSSKLSRILGVENLEILLYPSIEVSDLSEDKQAQISNSKFDLISHGIDCTSLSKYKGQKVRVASYMFRTEFQNSNDIQNRQVLIYFNRIDANFKVAIVDEYLNGNGILIKSEKKVYSANYWKINLDGAAGINVTGRTGTSINYYTNLLSSGQQALLVNIDYGAQYDNGITEVPVSSLCE